MTQQSWIWRLCGRNPMRQTTRFAKAQGGKQERCSLNQLKIAAPIIFIRNERVLLPADDVAAPGRAESCWSVTQITLHDACLS
jgi:hypothetical protein